MKSSFIVSLMALSVLLSSGSCLSAFAQDGIRWVNPVEAGAEVFGHGWPEMRNCYNRLPDKAQGVVPKSVWLLGRNSSGLSIVFRSDAPEIRVRYQVEGGRAMYHMPATGVSGVDLYMTDNRGRRHFVAPKTPASFKDTISYKFCNLEYPGAGDSNSRTYRLSLPLYNTVSWLEIGIPEGHGLEFVPVGDAKPVVIYGSSITQGACVSRPSMCWPSIVSAELGVEVVNLGFSGSGKGEKEVFDLLSEIDASVFVVDCIPNMSLDEPVRERLLYGIRKLRESHDYPILLAEFSVCGQSGAMDSLRTEQTAAKNAILRDVYRQLKKEGMKGLYYLKASDWSATMDGYVEGLHPNDYGMKMLAEGMVRRLKRFCR